MPPPAADRSPDDRLKEILYFLKLGRYFDERMEALYRQGRLPGAIYSGRGQEGTHVGVAYALEPEDSLFPTHRDLTAQLDEGPRPQPGDGAVLGQDRRLPREAGTATATSATGTATAPTR